MVKQWEFARHRCSELRPFTSESAPDTIAVRKAGQKLLHKHLLITIAAYRKASQSPSFHRGGQRPGLWGVIVEVKEKSLSSGFFEPAAKAQ